MEIKKFKKLWVEHLEHEGFIQVDIDFERGFFNFHDFDISKLWQLNKTLVNKIINKNIAFYNDDSFNDLQYVFHSFIDDSYLEVAYRVEYITQVINELYAQKCYELRQEIRETEEDLDISYLIKFRNYESIDYDRSYLSESIDEPFTDETKAVAVKYDRIDEFIKEKYEHITDLLGHSKFSLLKEVL